MRETWKEIRGFENFYEVSSFGRIRRLFVRSANAKLTFAQVKEAARMRKEGFTLKQIADKYGVGSPSILQAIDSIGKTKSRRKPQRIRILYKNPAGYLYVNLSKDGKIVTRMVHQLVLENFVGPCPEGCEPHHKNADPSDNHLENLEYLTHAQNLARRRHSDTAKKLSEPDAIYMRGMRESGFTVYQIAEAFKVTRRTVYMVLQNKSHHREPCPPTGVSL